MPARCPFVGLSKPLRHHLGEGWGVRRAERFREATYMTDGGACSATFAKSAVALSGAVDVDVFLYCCRTSVTSFIQLMERLLLQCRRLSGTLPPAVVSFSITCW